MPEMSGLDYPKHMTPIGYLEHLRERQFQLQTEISETANDNSVPEHMLDAHAGYVDQLVYELDIIEFEIDRMERYLAS
jgi:hypothetical protein